MSIPCKCFIGPARQRGVLASGHIQARNPMAERASPVAMETRLDWRPGASAKYGSARAEVEAEATASLESTGHTCTHRVSFFKSRAPALQLFKHLRIKRLVLLCVRHLFPLRALESKRETRAKNDKRARAFTSSSSHHFRAQLTSLL